MIGHVALVYRDADDLVARVSAALAQVDDPTLVLACRPAVTDGITAAVTAATGTAPDARLDRPDTHSRPTATLAGLRRLARDLHDPARHLVMVIEPDPGPDLITGTRATRFEAAVNLALADLPVTMICAYPRVGGNLRLPDLVRCHTGVFAGGVPGPNARHVDPATVLRRLGPHSPPRAPAVAPRLHVTDSRSIRDLSGIRAAVTGHLADVATLVRTDFVAAVNEVLTNGYLHGAPPLDLTVWVQSGHIECRVTDRGAGQPDPVAGYQPQPTTGRAGAGLWLARQACDTIDTWRHDEAFTVRLATAVTAGPARRHAGALARAETARARAILAAGRRTDRGG